MNNNPNIKNSIKLGLVGALVYFLKYTGLTIFFAISLFSIIFGFLYKRNYLKNYIIAFVTFFILTSPYLIENYTKFNKHIFYNVNSEFYIWADSWDEIVEGVRANNDRLATMDEVSYRQCVNIFLNIHMMFMKIFIRLNYWYRLLA